MPPWFELFALVASPVFAAGGAYAAVRVELRWHRREIDRAHERLNWHDERFLALLRERT